MRDYLIEHMGTRKCIKCLSVKSTLRFTGSRNECKMCAAKKQAEYRASKPERTKELNRKHQESWRQNHPGLNTERVKECYARKKGIV